ncbi:MAG: hypothetical protein ACK5LK_00815 [Chthoniobacterales bacterium]
MLVEIEILEDGKGFNDYSGHVDDEELNLVLEGKFEKPFLRLDNVFWTRYDKAANEWSEPELSLIKYGEGNQRNYQGSMFIRVSMIVNIHPLKQIAARDGTK